MTTIAYRVERASGSLGRPLDLGPAMDVIRGRLLAWDPGETLHVRKEMYELPPADPPGTTAFTAEVGRVYRLTVQRFAWIGWAGGFACKWADSHVGSVSQHCVRIPTAPNAYNAVDWVAPSASDDAAIIDQLTKVARWTVAEAQAGRLPAAQVIWQDRIWQAGSGWAAFTGTFHATHVHVSAAPMRTKPGACLT